MAFVAVAGFTMGGLLAMPDSARADETWRDGGCSQGEGQTVVVDWSQSLDESSDSPGQLFRCIPLGPDAVAYPVDVEPATVAVLAAAGIPFETDGFVTKINNIPNDSTRDWHYVTGEITEEGPVWLGAGSWQPTPGVDTFVGITLTADPESASGNPVQQPQFDLEPVPAPPPVVTPTPTKTATADGGDQSSTPSQTTSPTQTASASTTPTATSTPPPTQTATSTPPPTQTATGTPTATTPASAPTTTSAPARTQPTRPPRQTYRPRSRPNYQPPPPDYGPQQPMNPPLPPLDDPFPPPPIEDPIDAAPPEDISGQATGAANPTPSRVWGREDVVRDSADGGTSGEPGPWSQLAVLAGAVVVVGGLGTAFARGLQMSQPPAVEEE